MDPGADSPGLREHHVRAAARLLGPLLALLVYALLPDAQLGHAGRATAAVAVLMACWWVTEAMPLAATSLLPVVLFPLLGVGSIKQATEPYSHSLIFLFLGGFLLAGGMERHGLHRRFALVTIRTLGTSPRRLVAGFMVAVAFLSMWVSNTATVVMMMPTGVSVADLVLARVHAEGDDPARLQDARLFGAALVLAIAYASSIGGVGTLIGTPPNALLAAFLEKQYGQVIGFGAWMKLGLPVVLVMLPLTWWILTRVSMPFQLREVPGGAALIDEELAELGPASRAELTVLVVFTCAAALWIGRPFFARWLPGLDDASIAVGAALALFLLPSGGGDPGDDRVLSWEVAARVPWGVLLLFGGGLSLAAAMSRCGVAVFLGDFFHGLAGVQPAVIVFLVTLMVILLTEFTSNTATTAALLPVLAGVARGVEVHPLLLMVPAVMAASCAFMLPAATAANAIALGTERVTLRQMMAAGVWLNLVGVAWIAAFCSLWGGAALGMDLGTFPDWAR